MKWGRYNKDKTIKMQIIRNVSIESFMFLFFITESEDKSAVLSWRVLDYLTPSFLNGFQKDKNSPTQHRALGRLVSGLFDCFFVMSSADGNIMIVAADLDLVAVFNDLALFV